MLPSSDSSNSCNYAADAIDAKISLDELRAQLARNTVRLRATSPHWLRSSRFSRMILHWWLGSISCRWALPPISVSIGVRLSAARGTPAWFRLPGTGCWRAMDRSGYIALHSRLVTRSVERRGSERSVPGPLIRRLRPQRLDPLMVAFKATAAGLPAVRRLIVLPTENMAACRWRPCSSPPTLGP